MQFPIDHYTHSHKLEWWYFWGKLSSGGFFHFANFKLELAKRLVSRWIHYSVNNKYFELEQMEDEKNEYYSTFDGRSFYLSTPNLSLLMLPKCSPVIHRSGTKCYYSIPKLSGSGLLNGVRVTADVWMDHEFRHLPRLRSLLSKQVTWDWIGVKLDEGIYIMAYSTAKDPICNITKGKRSYLSEFSLKDNSLQVNKLSSTYKLDPVYLESKFSPKLGLSYSEQPFRAIKDGKVIGYGMRERTYF